MFFKLYVAYFLGDVIGGYLVFDFSLVFLSTGCCCPGCLFTLASFWLFLSVYQENKKVSIVYVRFGSWTNTYCFCESLLNFYFYWSFLRPFNQQPLISHRILWWWVTGPSADWATLTPLLLLPWMTQMSSGSGLLSVLTAAHRSDSQAAQLKGGVDFCTRTLMELSRTPVPYGE